MSEIIATPSRAIFIASQARVWTTVDLSFVSIVSLDTHYATNISGIHRYMLPSNARPIRKRRTERTTYTPVVAIHGKHLEREHGGGGAVYLELSGRCHDSIACGPPDGRVLFTQHIP